MEKIASSGSGLVVKKNQNCQLWLPSLTPCSIGASCLEECMLCKCAHAALHLTKTQLCTSHNRILALEKLGAVFNQVSWPLQYTPRRFVIHPESSNLIIIETDHNAYTEETKQQRKQQMAEVC